MTRALIQQTQLSLRHLLVESAQILIFLKDFIELVPMKGTTTGADILKALLQCTKSMSLDLSKLLSITTDRAPAMIGKNKGAIALLQKHSEALGLSNKITKNTLLNSPGDIVHQDNKLEECDGHRGENCKYDFV